VQVHIAELRDDKIEDVRFPHFLDFGLELEKIEDGADVGRELFDVTDEVLVDIVWIALQLLKRQWAVIVETLTCGFVE